MTESRSLRRAFTGNAIFSLACAALFIVDAEPLAALAGLPSPLPLQIVGAGLVPFGAWLLWLARRPGLSENAGRAVSLMDAQWVVGTAILLAGWPELLNPLGRVLAVAIAMMVATFAIWQLKGARQIAASH